jgi:antitoxin PrlF
MTRITATITGKGQVTIPAEVRRHLGVSPSDQVEFIIDRDGDVHVERARYSIEDLCGILPAFPGQSTDIVKEIREAFEEATDRRMSRWMRDE